MAAILLSNSYSRKAAVVSAEKIRQLSRQHLPIRRFHEKQIHSPCNNALCPDAFPDIRFGTIPDFFG
jgi:hypothetical protein